MVGRERTRGGEEWKAGPSSPHTPTVSLCVSLEPGGMWLSHHTSAIVISHAAACLPPGCARSSSHGIRRREVACIRRRAYQPAKEKKKKPDGASGHMHRAAGLVLVGRDFIFLVLHARAEAGTLTSGDISHQTDERAAP